MFFKYLIPPYIIIIIALVCTCIKCRKVPIKSKIFLYTMSILIIVGFGISILIIKSAYNQH